MQPDIIQCVIYTRKLHKRLYDLLRNICVHEPPNLDGVGLAKCDARRQGELFSGDIGPLPNTQERGFLERVRFFLVHLNLPYPLFILCFVALRLLCIAVCN